MDSAETLVVPDDVGPSHVATGTIFRKQTGSLGVKGTGRGGDGVGKEGEGNQGGCPKVLVAYACGGQYSRWSGVRPRGLQGGASGREEEGSAGVGDKKKKEEEEGKEGMVVEGQQQHCFVTESGALRLWSGDTLIQQKTDTPMQTVAAERRSVRLCDGSGGGVGG